MNIESNRIYESTKIRSNQVIRILAIADIDQNSTASLVEYALKREYYCDDESNQKSNTSLSHQSPIGSANVDLCIVIGPFIDDENDDEHNDSIDKFCGDELEIIQHNHENDLAFRVQRKRQIAKKKMKMKHLKNLNQSQGYSNYFKLPSSCKREDDAAKEGTVSAILSQLETIACRLCFIPGRSDPISMFGVQFHEENKLKELSEHKRFTHSSRNLHNVWLQLAPSLGCVGLADYSHLNDEEFSNISAFANRDKHAPQSHFYRNALEKLLDNAAPSTTSQAIVVSHFCCQPQKPNSDHHHEESCNQNDDKKVTALEETPALCDQGALTEYLTSKKGQEQIKLYLTGPCNQGCHESLLDNDGKSASIQSFYYDIKYDNLHVICPGSLKKNGDFALIDLEYDNTLIAHDAESSSMVKEQHLNHQVPSDKGDRKSGNISTTTVSSESKWKISRVEFHSIFQAQRQRLSLRKD